MSLPSVHEFELLNDLALEIREVFAERGYRVSQALSLDSSFERGEDPRSTLARALMRDAAAIAAGKVGMGVERAAGGSCNVQSFDGNVDRRYRVRRAKEREDGTFLIEANSDAILRLDGDSLYREERWVLAYTLDADNQINTLFVAEILEVVEGTPGYLVLGTVHRLGTTGGGMLGGGRFDPAEEDLDGFDDEDDSGTDSGVG